VCRGIEDCVGASEYGFTWTESEWWMEDRKGRMRYPICFRRDYCAPSYSWIYTWWLQYSAKLPTTPTY
jgi:hypothetical protein